MILHCRGNRSTIHKMRYRKLVIYNQTLILILQVWLSDIEMSHALHLSAPAIAPFASGVYCSAKRFVGAMASRPGSSTLALCRELHSSGKKITTVEDPLNRPLLDLPGLVRLTFGKHKADI